MKDKRFNYGLRLFSKKEGGKASSFRDKLILAPAPHMTKKGNTTRRLMLNVIIALAPVSIAAIVFFGYMVVVNLFFCIVFCMGLELLYGMIEKKDFSLEAIKESSVWNLSCVVTGIILALNLPASLNLFGATNQGLVFISTIFADFLGSLMAIVVAKMLFGGIGRNFANPALVGRVFLLMCFAKAMTTVSTAHAPGLTAVTGATWLKQGGELTGTNILDMLLGNVNAAAVGETCAIAIIAGFVFLCVTKTIDFKLPLVTMASVAVFALLFEGTKLSGTAAIYNALAHMLSGGILFGAVFMATDYATSPNTQIGLIIYGLGIGFVTMLIRSFGAMPEGASFAILIMNLFVPILDKYIVPRPFGVRRHND